MVTKIRSKELHKWEKIWGTTKLVILAIHSVPYHTISSLPHQAKPTVTSYAHHIIAHLHKSLKDLSPFSFSILLVPNTHTSILTWWATNWPTFLYGLAKLIKRSVFSLCCHKHIYKTLVSSMLLSHEFTKMSLLLQLWQPRGSHCFSNTATPPPPEESHRNEVNNCMLFLAKAVQVTRFLVS